jgi:hypothetical protein
MIGLRAEAKKIKTIPCLGENRAIPCLGDEAGEQMPNCFPLPDAFSVMVLSL